MNNTNAKLLIAALGNGGMAFSMRNYFSVNGNPLSDYVDEVVSYKNHCGTAACLAGHAALLSGAKRGRIQHVAESWLDIEWADAHWLVNGQFSWRKDTTSVGNYYNWDFLNDVTKNETIAALRWLMAGNSRYNWIPSKENDNDQ